MNASDFCVSPGPPYMQVTIEDVQVNAGERAKFQAVIEGTPQPTVLWFKVSADVSLDCGKDWKAVLLWGQSFYSFILHFLHWFWVVSVDAESAAGLPGTPVMHLALSCLQGHWGSFHREDEQRGLGTQVGRRCLSESHQDVCYSFGVTNGLKNGFAIVSWLPGSVPLL